MVSPVSSGMVSPFSSRLVSPFSSWMVSPFPSGMLGVVGGTPAPTTLKMSLCMELFPVGHELFGYPRGFRFLWVFLEAAFSVAVSQTETKVCCRRCVSLAAMSVRQTETKVCCRRCVFGCRTRRAVVCTGHDRRQSTERQATLLASSPSPLSPPPPPPSLFRRPWK